MARINNEISYIANILVEMNPVFKGGNNKQKVIRSTQPIMDKP